MQDAGWQMTVDYRYAYLMGRLSITEAVKRIQIVVDVIILLFAPILHNETRMWKGDDLLEELQFIIKVNEEFKILLAPNANTSLRWPEDSQLLRNTFGNKGFQQSH